MYYPREIEEKVRYWLGQGLSVIIKGPRAAGKTTLLKHLNEDMGGTYVTLEDPQAYKRFREDIKTFYRIYGDELMFIDEVQYDPEAGKKLKYLYDVEGVQFVATGSGSFDVKVNVSGYLVGRAVSMELLPLSFSEFVLWKRRKMYSRLMENKEVFQEILNGERSEPLDLPLNDLYEEYISYGGYPLVVLNKRKEEILKNIIEAYIEKDIAYFFNLLKKGEFRLFAEVLSRIQGSVVRLSNLVGEIDLSLPTLRNYLNLLEQTFIVKIVRAYGGGLREFRRSKKVYFIDQGIRNALKGSFMSDGSSHEAFVLRILNDYGKVFYYRTKSGAEVDFLLKWGEKIVPIEVKTGCRSTRVLRKLADKHGFGIVFCKDKIGWEGNILYLTPWSVA